MDSRCYRALVALGVGLLGCGAQVWASPTAPGVMPTPQTLSPRTFELQLQSHGIQVLQAAEAWHQLGVQVGVTPDLEIGFDYRLGAPQDSYPNRVYRTELLGYDPRREGWERSWMNLKYQILRENPRRPAVAVGLLSLNARGDSGYYVVAGKQLGAWGLAVGYADAYGDDDAFWYEVLTYTTDDGGRVVAEHCSGGRFSTNVAYEHRFNARWRAAAGWMFANNGLYDSEPLLRLTYTDGW